MTTKKNLVKMMLMSIATAVSFTFNACSNDDLPVAKPSSAYFSIRESIRQDLSEAVGISVCQWLQFFTYTLSLYNLN